MAAVVGGTSPGAVAGATVFALASAAAFAVASVLQQRSARTAPPRETASTLTAIPYFLWANRAQGSMVVWVPEATA